MFLGVLPPLALILLVAWRRAHPGRARALKWGCLAGTLLWTAGILLAVAAMPGAPAPTPAGVLM